MRISERAHKIAIAQTELEIQINDYFSGRNLDLVEIMRAVSFELRNVFLDMSPVVDRAETFSALKDLIKAHQIKHEMTNIEVAQALVSFIQSDLKYMLRYERHGDYDTPAMLDKD